MIKKLLFSALCVGFSVITNAQSSYTYDFGTETGVLQTSASTASNFSAGTPTQTGATTPKVPLPAIDGGTAKIKFSTTLVPGVMELVSTGTTFGTGSRLKLTLPQNATATGTSSSAQKFSIYSWLNPTKYVKASFNIKFEAGTAGAFIFAMGNETIATSFSNGNNPGAGSAFGLRWEYAAGSIGLRTMSGATNTYTAVDAINTQTYTAGSEYSVIIFVNNSLNNILYTQAATNYALAPNSYQVWINGARVLFSTGVFDFPKGSIADDAVIDGLALCGIPVANASGAVIIDNLVYSTFPQVLPVSLTSFTAKPLNNAVQLNWVTASENNNSHFDLEKSTDGNNFIKFTSKPGAGNSNNTINYAATDNNPYTGTSYYKLIQVDFDGKRTEFLPQAVKLGLNDIAANLAVYATKNTSGLSMKINIEKAGRGDFEIFNIAGQKILSKKLILNDGQNSFTIDDANLSVGTYIATFKYEGKILTQKFSK